VVKATDSNGLSGAPKLSVGFARTGSNPVAVENDLFYFLFAGGLKGYGKGAKLSGRGIFLGAGGPLGEREQAP
jgi:hypothetical protein